MAVVIPIVQYAMLAYEAYSLYETLTAKPQLPANQISDLSVQTSDWGTGIPQIYGVQRLAGNIIWSTAKMLTGGTQGKFGGKGGGGGGKGGGGKGKKGTGSQGYYTAAVAFALCEGPVAGIKRIWAGGQLIFDDSAPVYVPSMNQNQPQGTYVQFETVNQPIVSTGGSSLGPWTLYHGTGSQNPDPTIVSNGSGIGTNGVPYQTVSNQNGNVYTYGSPQFGKQGTACAYRGLAYIVFPNLNLGYGGTMPQLTFEVVGKQTTLVFDVTGITQSFIAFPSSNGSAEGAYLADGQYLYVGYNNAGKVENACINITSNQFISLYQGNAGGNACNLVQQVGSEVAFFNYDIFLASIPNYAAITAAITNEYPQASFVLNNIAWALVGVSSGYLWLCSPSFVSGGGNGVLPTTDFFKYGTGYNLQPTY
ncbi:MAG: hypothetical protein ACYC0M_15570, partial [Burkholderiales bacterium]